jgi:hypothetical protein
LLWGPPLGCSERGRRTTRLKTACVRGPGRSTLSRTPPVPLGGGSDERSVRGRQEQVGVHLGACKDRHGSDGRMRDVLGGHVSRDGWGSAAVPGHCGSYHALRAAMTSRRSLCTIPSPLSQKRTHQKQSPPPPTCGTCCRTGCRGLQMRRLAICQPPRTGRSAVRVANMAEKHRRSSQVSRLAPTRQIRTSQIRGAQWRSCLLPPACPSQQETNLKGRPDKDERSLTQPQPQAAATLASAQGNLQQPSAAPPLEPVLGHHQPLPTP